MRETVLIKDPAIPRDAAGVTAAAAALGFRVSDACMPGVVANLAVLARQADILRGGARA